MTIPIRSNFAKKEMVIRIENSVTARRMVHEAEAREGECYFIRGYITGIFDVIFGVPTYSIEMRCMCKGDPFCEFYVKGKNS